MAVLVVPFFACARLPGDPSGAAPTQTGQLQPRFTLSGDEVRLGPLMTGTPVSSAFGLTRAGRPSVTSTLLNYIDNSTLRPSGARSDGSGGHAT